MYKINVHARVHVVDSIIKTMHSIHVHAHVAINGLCSEGALLLIVLHNCEHTSRHGMYTQVLKFASFSVYMYPTNIASYTDRHAQLRKCASDSYTGFVRSMVKMSSCRHCMALWRGV